MTTLVFAGVGASSYLANEVGVDAAAGRAGPGNTVASGVTPDGSIWTLTSGDSPTWSESSSSDSITEATHCFGLSTGRWNGRSETCHDVPDNPRTWLHIQSLAGSGDEDAVIYGEVSKAIKEIEITLKSGEVLTPDVINASDSPYSYFVSFVASDARGTIVIYESGRKAVNERRFTLHGDELGEDAP